MPRDRSHRLINALVAGIQAHEGRRVAAPEIADYVRIRPATLSKWMNARTQLEQIEWLLRLLERVPEDRWFREMKEVLMKKRPSRKASAKERGARRITSRGRRR